jgi:GT2 family glycosyltransferase
MPTAPRVRAIVVNYRRADLTAACVESLLHSEWPPEALDIVVVDNGSGDGSVDELRARFPGVSVIASATNLGFGGGNNLALRDLDGIDHVALVNNDATVDPSWLAPLVAALDADPTRGAACPRIDFAGRFQQISLTADARGVPVGLAAVEVDGVDVWRRVQWIEGFGDPWLDEVHTRSFRGAAHIRVPDGTAVRVRVVGPRGTKVSIACGDAVEHYVLDGSEDRVELGVVGDPVDVVDNIGNLIDAWGFVADRGFQEIDRAKHPTAEVFAWCGAAVLLPTPYLRRVGLFDERLFMYYEDVELAWRGRELGYRYVFVPDSLVHHLHAATSDASSEQFAYLNERNRLLVLLRHATPTLVLRGIAFHFRVTISYVVRGLRSRDPVRARSFAAARARTRALAGFLRLAPAMARSRSSARRAR